MQCLWFHSAYRCRHAGACCTSAWPIPVEAPLRDRLDAALADGSLMIPHPSTRPFLDQGEMPPGVRGILRMDSDGACAFYDRSGRRCSVHSALGHDALPVSCQIFPRVCLQDAAGTFVTLSHYCPTSAGLLFEEARQPAFAQGFGGAAMADEGGKPRPAHVIVEAPSSFAPMPLEGLDARDALPPLLHPKMLMDVESYHAWERMVVGMLVSEGMPEAVLGRAIRYTEGLRTWEPAHGSLQAAVNHPESEPGGEAERNGGPPGLHASGLALDRRVRGAVPAGFDAPPPPPDAASDFQLLVAPAWPAVAGPVKRYLAARLFANWCAYQGRGLRTVLCSVAAALAVLRVEAARHCAAAGRALDAALLTQAFRSADLLIVHLASREQLAREFGAIEEESADELAQAL